MMMILLWHSEQFESDIIISLLTKKRDANAHSTHDGDSTMSFKTIWIKYHYKFVDQEKICQCTLHTWWWFYHIIHSKPFESDIIITLLTKKICDNAHHCWLCGFIQNHLNQISNKVGWPRKGMAMHKRLWFVNVIKKQSNQISLYVAKSTMVH